MAENDPKSTYSPAFLRLFVKVKQAETREQRGNLMTALATQFCREHDITDPKLNDGYHDYFEEFERTRLKFQQAAIRLARLAMHEIEESGIVTEESAEVAGRSGTKSKDLPN